MALSRIDMDIADVLMETPIGFAIGRRHFYLYPMTLGKSLIAGRVLDTLGIQGINDNERLSSFLVLATAKTKRADCLKLIAYCSLKGDECLDNEKVDRRVKQFRRLSDSEVATLITVILTSDKTSEISKHFAFGDMQSQLERVMKVKMANNDSIIFGGKSIWGKLIDFACERYGWTIHHVLWEVSYANLTFLMIDHVRDVFMTKEERMAAHVVDASKVIHADNAQELEDFVAKQNWR